MAYEIQLNTNVSIDQVEKEVFSRIDQIKKEAYESDSLYTKLDIMKEKINIISEFEQKFNEYKSTIVNLNNDILNLRKVISNISKLELFRQEKKNLKKDYEMEMLLLREVNKDEYIPAVYAYYIDLPIKNEDYREPFINRHILKTMIEMYGINKIFSSTRLEDGILHDLVKLRTHGKLEEDGIRNYDGKGIYEIDKKNLSKCFRIKFVRFKPFFEDSVSKGQMKDEKNLYSIGANIKLWDLSKRNSFINISTAISQKFIRNNDEELSNVQTYILSLGEVSETIKESRKRIQRIVENFREIEKEFQERLSFYDRNIEGLEKINDNLLTKVGIHRKCSKNEIKQYIERKREQRQELEKSFEYQFVIMDSQSPNPSFESALSHVLDNIFHRIEKMVEHQAISINYIVSMGITQENTEKSMSFLPNFTNVDIKPFIDTGNVGVMLSLSVRYQQASSSKKISKPHRNPFEQPKKEPKIFMPSIIPTDESKDEYIERAMDINIQLTHISKGSTSFYMSNADISKGQFVTFLNDTNKTLGSYIGDQFCLNLIQSYPDNFPMICVNKTGIKKFINWLCIKSGKQYSLPTSRQQSIASQFKMYKGNGFRVVLKNIN